MKISLSIIGLLVALAFACLSAVSAGPGIARYVTFTSSNCDPKQTYTVSPLLPPVLGNAPQYRCVNVSQSASSFLMQQWSEYSSYMEVESRDPRCISGYFKQDFMYGVCQNTTTRAGGPSSVLIISGSSDVPDKSASPKLPESASAVNIYNMPRCDSPKSCNALATITYYTDQYCNKANYTQAIAPATLVDGTPIEYGKCYTEPSLQSHSGEVLNNIQFSCSFYSFEVVRSLSGCGFSGQTLSKMTYSTNSCVQFAPGQWFQYECKR